MIGGRRSVCAPADRHPTVGLIGTEARVRTVTARELGRVVLLLLVLLSLAPYGNAPRADFTFDDAYQIRTNPVVMSHLDVFDVLATPLYPGDLYRPFTTLSFAINQALDPDDPSACHLVNLLLHALVTLSVAYLAQLLFGSWGVSFLAGAVFAVHPIHTEAVTSLVGRAEELAALGGLASLLAIAHADRASTAARRRLWFGFSLIGFCVALLSKESAITLLPLIFLWRIVLRQEPWLRGLWNELRQLDWIPYACCTGLYLLLRVTVIGWSTEPVLPLNNILTIVPGPLRMATSLGILFDGFSQMVAPLVLSADYSHAQLAVLTSWLDFRCLGGLAVVLASMLLVSFARAPLAFAAAFPLVTLSLTSNFFFPIGTIRAERLLYLPSVGWALLFGVGVDSLRRHLADARPLYAAVAVWLLLLAARTWVRNADWNDDFSLHESTVEAAPASAKGHYNYAIALRRNGQPRAAMHHFLRALELYPWSNAAANSIGRLFEEAAAPQRAELWFERATRIDPTYVDGYVNLCRNRLMRQQFAPALSACRAGLRFNPRHGELLKGLGGSLIGLGERDKGLYVLHRAATINPHDAGLRQSIADLEAPARQGAAQP